MARFGYRIVVEWSDEDEAYIARVPTLGAMAHGDTPDEAMREAQVAARAMLEVLRERGEPLPPEDASASYSGRVLLRMSRRMHAELVQRAAADGVSLNQTVVSLLARGMGETAPGEHATTDAARRRAANPRKSKR